MSLHRTEARDSSSSPNPRASRPRRATWCAWIVAIGASLSFAAQGQTATLPDRPSLVTRSAAGIAAYDSLTVAYSSHEPERPTTAAREAIAHGSVDAAIQAQQLLIAMARQSLADESNGRARWTQTPYWGGGEESDARGFRESLLTNLEAIGLPDRVRDLLEWFVLQDPVAGHQQRAAALLVRGNNAMSGTVIHRVLSQPHPDVQVVAMALREARSRNIRSELAPAVRLLNHPSSTIRSLSESLMVAFGAPNRAAQRPERWLTSALRATLLDIADAIHPRVAARTAWIRLRFATPSSAMREGLDVVSTQRLIDSTGASARLLDVFARERRISKDSVAMEPWSLHQEVERLVAIRGAGSTSELSVAGGITGQFEPSGPSMPELLVGAWAMEQGDGVSAARTILPALEATSSPTRLRGIAQHLLAIAYHHQMLEAFSYDWDYPRAVGYARALQRRLFAGQPHIHISREFERQLSHRTTDFKSFVLPDSAAWDSIRRGSDRRTQFEFLLPRLRLLNAFQEGQPGDVWFAWPQYATPSHQRDAWSNEVPRTGPRINPLTELGALDPNLADVSLLLPWLEDRDYLPTFGFWRDFHPSRTHYQVGQVVQWIINGAADQPLVSFEDYQALDRVHRDRYRARVADWARARVGWTANELNREVLRTSPKQNVVWSAAEEAARRRDVEAAPLIVRRRPEFPNLGGYLDQAVARFDSVALDQIAHQTLLSDSTSEWANAGSDSGLIWQQLWAAQRVMRARPGSLRARAAATRALEADPTGKWGAQWAASVISGDSIAMAPMLCRQLEKPEFLHKVQTDERLVKQLIDEGCNAALEHYLWNHFLREVEFLKRRPASDSAGSWLKKLEHNRKEQVARRARQWPEAPLIDPSATMDAFAEQVQTFRVWLSEHCRARGRP